ncbi:YceI-like domain-containing protein [Algoriphagus ornithinivorans]|uniref:YceI-like domain-containing protein n=1 Tax=Algoriphagus ornithinivorans TaxID=226506 RepID=A0A1I5GSW8_9BACT|nr:YceI family protein [Algoriphagus ornithinivorans]SFO39095.1 YceI-like domain-containing protein [Algoriphagus ornithinivorans]
MRNLIIAFLFFLPSLAFSQSFKTESGEAIFLSKAPLNEFTGESEKLKGLIDLEKNLVDFYLDLNTLKTGIGLRDRHMRENYLETDKFPFAEFTGKMKSIPALNAGTTYPVVVVGKFKIHGIERNVEITGNLQKTSSGNIELKAKFDILLGDYEIPLPKLVFYELAEKQEVSINATLKPVK